MPAGCSACRRLDATARDRYRFPPRFGNVGVLIMALKIGLLGKKIGMTHVYTEDGEAIPVTVIQAGPCHVVGTRTEERDGYSALVLGFDEKPVRSANKAELGIAKAANIKPQRFIREI